MNAGTNGWLRGQGVKGIVAVGLLAAVLGTGHVARSRWLGAEVAEARETVTADERVKRGAYLVSVLGCHDCHTPWKMGANGPEPDMTRQLSGHPEFVRMTAPPASLPDGWAWIGAETNTAFHGPWGTSYAANLTPDRNTGLGIWTEDIFFRAIRTGKHWGTSRPIMPPMPWTVYRNLTDEDLRSVFAYLRTIPPVVNHVPDYQPPARAITDAQ